MVVDVFRHRHDTVLRVFSVARSPERMDSSIAFQHLEAARETRGLRISKSPSGRAERAASPQAWMIESNVMCLPRNHQPIRPAYCQPGYQRAMTPNRATATRPKWTAARPQTT